MLNNALAKVQKPYIRKRRQIICECDTITITISRKYDRRNDNQNAYASQFLEGEHAYIIKPQSIELTNLTDCEVRTYYDCCYELICKSCKFSFKIVTYRSYAIITEPKYGDDIVITSSSLMTSFPFQLRPFIQVFNMSKSCPRFDLKNDCQEEEDQDNLVSSYDMNNDELIGSELIVGDIPSGFLLF